VDQDTIPVGVHDVHGCRGTVKGAGEVGGKNRVESSWAQLDPPAFPNIAAGVVDEDIEPGLPRDAG